MSANLHTMCRRRLKNECIIFHRQSLQAPLHHMISVEILYERHHPRSERLGHHGHLFVARQRFYQLLYGPGSVHVDADVH